MKCAAEAAHYGQNRSSQPDGNRVTAQGLDKYGSEAIYHNTSVGASVRLSESSNTNPEILSSDPEISPPDPKAFISDPKASSLDPEASSASGPEASSPDPEASSASDPKDLF